jgi:hypothetical protein
MKRFVRSRPAPGGPGPARSLHRLSVLAVLLAGCSSDKYVHIQTSDGRSFYAKRAEADRVDAEGMIDVENVLTKKRVTLKLSDCVIRSASRGEVTRAKGYYIVYEK